MQKIPWKLLLRLLIAVAAGVYLYYSLNWEEFAHLFSESNGFWILGAFLIYGGTTTLAVLRWHVLLSSCHAQMRLVRTAQLTMVGLFGNTFLPGMMGGDVLKVMYAVREIPHIKPTVVMSIVMERFLGFMAMFIISIILILARFHALTSEPVTRYAVYVYFVVFGSGIGLILLAAGFRGKPPLIEKLPFGNSLCEAWGAYQFFVKHPKCFWGGLGLSGLAHGCLIGTFYFVSLALRMRLHFFDLAAVLPLVGLVTLIPTTPNSIGVREVAFQHFLTFAGMSRESSVALSLSASFVILFWNLIGGLVYLQFKSPKQSVP